MTTDVALNIGREALYMVLLLSAPMLGLGLLVGVLVSIFQATTQIQEQTLSFIPKIVAVFGAILVFGPWMMRLMVDYTRNLFMIIPQMIK